MQMYVCQLQIFSYSAYVLEKKESLFSVSYSFIVYQPLNALLFGKSKPLCGNITMVIKVNSTVMILN